MNKKFEDKLDKIIKPFLHNKILQAIYKVHKEISKEIEVGLFEIFKLKTQNPSLPLSQINWYRKMDKTILAIIEPVITQQMDLFTDMFKEVYKEGQKDAHGFFKGLGTNVAIDFNKPNLAHIQAVVTEVNDYFQRASKGIPVNIKRTINQLVNDQVIKKVATGQDLNRAIKDLVKKMEDKGIRFVSTSKRNYKLDTYAEMIVRTESRYMHTQAVKDTTRQSGYLYVKVSSHSHPSDLCAPHQGKIFFVGKDPKDNFLNKQPLDEIVGLKGLFHPNCKHIIMPYPARKPTD